MSKAGSEREFRAHHTVELEPITPEQVTFACKDAQGHTWWRMTLPGEEFLRRFLQHVLPPGFHKVRYYGLWAPAAQATRIRVQPGLDAASAAPEPNAPMVEVGPVAALPARIPCPHCAVGSLQFARRLAPCRGANAMPP